ncbi:MAG: hypothetical protein Q4G70_08125 [Pseudomonadota bacterium]|nr:hypothetical protein [Pseudomonadota bacterium]
MARQQVECETHGPSHAAFVCAHLCRKPGQKWFCDYPSPRNPAPDAWCAACEARFQAAGGWNAQIEAAAGIRLICQGCYQNLLGQSVRATEKPTRRAWNAFVKRCHAELHERQAALSHRLSAFERYDYDQASKRMVFSNGGQPGLLADIEIVGTLSHGSRTWMWSWANFSLLPKVRTRMKRVRTLGEEHGFPRLTTFIWPADAHDAWDMAAVAAHVLNADGVFRTVGEAADLFLTLSRVRVPRVRSPHGGARSVRR